ncbi:hypothetical protein EON67_01260 [archaeon]|nr:MAG: hypothetical protein EON67_01260 [archaeon]
MRCVPCVQVFENAKRIYREVRILRLLHHPAVVKVTHIQQPRCVSRLHALAACARRLVHTRACACATCPCVLPSHSSTVACVPVRVCSDFLHFTDLYIVFECMDTDLAKLTRDDTQCLTIPHVRWFLYQLLLSMKYVHSAHIIHRDIKVRAPPCTPPPCSRRACRAVTPPARTLLACSGSCCRAARQHSADRVVRAQAVRLWPGAHDGR